MCEPKRLDDYPKISVAKLHVFQNCLRDLEGDSGSLSIVREVLTNTLKQVAEGSLMVIIDLNYHRTRSLLRSFKEVAENELDCLIVRETVSDPVTIESEIACDHEFPPSYGRAQ